MKPSKSEVKRAILYHLAQEAWQCEFYLLHEYYTDECGVDPEWLADAVEEARIALNSEFLRRSKKLPDSTKTIFHKE